VPFGADSNGTDFYVRPLDAIRHTGVISAA